jgi:hypothetical protein
MMLVYFSSTALMDPMAQAFVAEIHGFVAARGVELVHFAKGQRKDELTSQFLVKFTEDGGAVRGSGSEEGRGVERPAALQRGEWGQLGLPVGEANHDHAQVAIPLYGIQLQ